MVPVRKGVTPEAPEGGHNSQLGTFPELVDPPVPPADPAEPDWPEEAAVADAPDRAEPDPAAEPVPEEPTAAEAPEFVAVVEAGGAIEGNCTAPYGVARPAPLVPEVWAAAARAKTTQRNKTI